jgi:UDP-N-acetylmuramate--alanine ligase
MVGKLTNKFKTICVAGCHGKTTTTAMLSHVLNELKGANYLIGDGTGYANIENEYFVLESCEYQRHFLAYTPYYAIITNIDLDHVDYFKNMDDVIDAYREYANKTENLILACGDDPYTHSLEVNKPIFFYGLAEDNDIIATNIEYKKTGTSFEVHVEGNYYGTFDLPIFGKHQLLDALAVLAVCYYERLEAKDVQKIFKTFTGAKRRFTETIVGDSIIIDDYAHHPNEVSATLHAVHQKYEGKQIISIFQPHTFSRTKEFTEDFIKVFEKVDKAYFLDIHPAREKQEDYPSVSSMNIVSQLENASMVSLETIEELAKYKGSVFVFMSPNDISALEEKLISKLKEE